MLTILAAVHGSTISDLADRALVLGLGQLVDGSLREQLNLVAQAVEKRTAAMANERASRRTGGQA